MNPSYEDLRTITTVCAFLLIGLALYLTRAPIGECSDCPHCRKVRAGIQEFCKLHGRPVNDCRNQHGPPK